MDCKGVEHYAAALAECILTAAEKRELEKHIQRCTRCRSIVVRVAELFSEIGSVETAELSPQFWPRLCRRLQAQDAGRSESSRRWTLWRRRLRPLLASTALLLGVWTGIHLGSAYALRKSLPTEKASASSAPEEPVFYPESLVELPRGSLSALLILDSLDAEPVRSKR
jgi:predicted anti-sigma-YlaC factor YlaD